MSVIAPQDVSRSQVGWAFMLLGALPLRTPWPRVSACGSERRAGRAILCTEIICNYSLTSRRLSGLNFDVAFPIVAWSSWVLNWLVAEMWLRRK